MAVSHNSLTVSKCFFFNHSLIIVHIFSIIFKSWLWGGQLGSILTAYSFEYLKQICGIILKYITCVVNLRQTSIDCALIFNRMNTSITSTQDSSAIWFNWAQTTQCLGNFSFRNIFSILTFAWWSKYILMCGRSSV